MHVVTKILIVAGAVLSILLAALTIAYASNADTIRESVGAEQSLRRAMAADLATERSSRSASEATERAKVEAAESARAALASEIANLQNERATLKAAVTAAERQADALRSQAESATRAGETNTKLIEALTTEVRELRRLVADGAKRESDLVGRLNDLESQRQVLDQSVRALQEQLNEAKMAVELARSGGAPGDSTAGARGGTVSFGPLVQARIRSITPGPSGDMIVEISEGSSAGLKTNQRLSIIRDGKFVANLILTAVEARGSAGRVDKLGRDVEVRVGDIVLSRLGNE